MLSERTLAEMVIQLGRSVCFECSGGLTPAQWTALRYFSRANRFSRTVSAFADFHLTTRGTASQTVKSLVGRGLLTRTQSDRDGRSVILDLTSEGQDVLGQDPFEALVGALTRLPKKQRRELAAGLDRVLEDLVRGRGGRRFGVCKDCSFLWTAHQPGRQPAFTCRLVGEPLQWQETRQLCVNFHPEQGEGEASASEPGPDKVPL
jgi:DNA-binding MarR family transcriptional regulator